MDFVTLPQLARDLNIPERRVRHRFRRLVAAGKLVEGKDFNKEEFQDEFHFTYMIHPQHFIQEAKFQKEAEDALRDRTDLLPPGTNLGNNSQPTMTCSRCWVHRVKYVCRRRRCQCLA